MTATLLPQGKQYYETNAGIPLVGGRVYTYDAGTTNPRTTWADAAETAPNINPVILDARGEALIYWRGNYKVVLKDAADVTIWTVDNVSSLLPSVAQSLIPAADNTYDLGSAAFAWRQLYLGAGHLPALDPSGQIGYWKRTAAEIVAAVVPTNYFYPPGNVRRYGAVGDGATDDTTAIQAALNAHAGASVCLPAATYKCTASISVPGGTLMYGDGMGVTTMTFNNPSANQIIFAGAKVTLRDLSIVITGVGVNSNVAAVNISGVDYCQVQRVEVSGAAWAGVGCFLTASHNLIEGCYFHDWQGTIQDSADVALSYLTGATNYNIIRDNYCLGGGENGIMILGTAGSNPQYNLVKGNRIGAHTTYGIVDYRSAAGQDSFDQVVDNYVENIQGTTRPGGGTSASGAGIYCLGSGGMLIANNKIRNCCVQTTFRSLSPAAIAVTGIGDPVAMAMVNVIGNVVDNMTKWDGILIADCPSGANVVGNTVRMPANSTGEAAINIAACSNVVCSDNNIEIQPVAGVTVCGITVSMVAPLTDQKNIVITNNNIRGGNSKAIRITSGGAFTLTNLVIANNNINGSGGGDDCIVLGARVTNGSINGNVINWTTNKCLVVSDIATRVRAANNVLITTGADSFYNAVACVSCYFDKTNFCSGNYLNASTGWITERLGNAAPATGNGAVGDRVEQSAPVVGQPKGWRCTVAGAPGTWVSEGNL